MSRPFSYNDENFTVIGNVLFCHIKINEPLEIDDVIAEIPPEIYYRLIQETVMGTISRKFGMNVFDVYKLSAYVSEEDGKYYLKTLDLLNGAYFIFTAYMFLKDI